MLTVSYTWMKGYAYDFLAILHAITVILTLVWLPFGKFFHMFQRPAQLGVSFYKDAGKVSEQAMCKRCGHAFASAMMVRDLITVERQLGFDYRIDDAATEHYQWICPRCRRAMLGLAQGADVVGRTGNGTRRGVFLSAVVPNRICGLTERRRSMASVIRLKRAYDQRSPSDGERILVERLWPRGSTKSRWPWISGLKTLLPAPELRKWFAHDPAKWKKFEQRATSEGTPKTEAGYCSA